MYEGNNSYTLHGCVQVILIWIYESIPGLEEKYGNHIEGGNVPLLSWSGSRTHINSSNLCAQEKKKY